MVHIITPDEDRLTRFREIAAPYFETARAEAYEVDRYWPNGLRKIGGGAPSINTVLAVLPGPATANTFTAAQTILSSSTTNQTCVGPFSPDYFHTTGATFEQEAMGIIGVVTATTPTVIFGCYMGNAIAAATAMCVTAAQTNISGQTNVNWYWRAMGHVRTITATTATIIVTGFLIGQIATAAAGNNTIWAVNATPPTAVTLDISGSVFVDLKATWSASAAGNTTTVNFYNLKSLYA